MRLFLPCVTREQSQILYATWVVITGSLNTLEILENAWHCGASLTEYTHRMWSSYMHLVDCHQNVAEPQATENHMKYTHVYTGSVSQAWL